MDSATTKDAIATTATTDGAVITFDDGSNYASSSSASDDRDGDSSYASSSSSSDPTDAPALQRVMRRERQDFNPAHSSRFRTEKSSASAACR